LDTSLERRTREELIALIKQMLRQEPELESLLETPLPVAGARRGPVDTATYRRQAAAVFHRAGNEWNAVYGIANGLHVIAGIGDGFAKQQDWAAAATVYRAVAEEVLEQYDSYHDEDGALGDVIQACVAGLGQCLAGEKDDRETRETIVRS